MCHIIYQYQTSHFCIRLSGVPGNKIFSPNASLRPHSTKGGKGFHWHLWWAWVALITEFAKYSLTGFGTMSARAAPLCLGSLFCILLVQLADKTPAVCLPPFSASERRSWLFTLQRLINTRILLCHTSLHALNPSGAGADVFRALGRLGLGCAFVLGEPQSVWWGSAQPAALWLLILCQGLQETQLPAKD